MVGNTEVTQKLYKQITGKSPSEFTGDYNPVEKVSWYDAVDFCNRYTDYLNKFGWGLKHAYKDINGVIYWDKSVRGVRLPTVAEWNIYAKSNGVLYQGYLDEISWWLDNSMNRTHPVAFKKPNKYGLFDIVGNVSEWLWDEDKNNPLLRGIYLSNFLTFEEDNDEPKFIDPTSKRSTIGFRVVI